MNSFAYASFTGSDETPTNRYWVLSIFGISGVLSSIILGIGLYKKVYRSLLSEFMMYIIISEIINSFSKLLSLNRYNMMIPFENFIAKWDKVMQLYIGIFVDTCTILTTLIISIKIYDGSAYCSKIFKNKSYQIVARIVILTVPVFISILLGSIHMLTYPKQIQSSSLNDIEKLCDLISCRVDDPILMGQYSINIVFIGLTVIINVLTVIFLRKKKREISSKITTQSLSSTLIKATVDNINSSEFKIYLFPFINIIIWLVFMSCNLYYHNISEGGLKKYKYPLYYLWLYSIFHGLRGVLYSLLFIFTRSELINYIFCLHLCKRSLEEINQNNNVPNELMNSQTIEQEKDYSNQNIEELEY